MRLRFSRKVHHAVNIGYRSNQSVSQLYLGANRFSGKIRWRLVGQVGRRQDGEQKANDLGTSRSLQK
jgi:hypothetical protein